VLAAGPEAGGEPLAASHSIRAVHGDARGYVIA